MAAFRAAVVAALLSVGVAFTVVAVVGLFRLPDVYARAHATSKSETLGALLALAAAAVAFGDVATTAKIAALALFLLVTGPTAAHAIVRSAADQGIEPWNRDDLAADGPGAAAADRTPGSGADRSGSGGDRAGSGSWGEGR